MNKKGMSQVLATLLFVILALGAVLLVWTLMTTEIENNQPQFQIVREECKTYTSLIECDGELCNIAEIDREVCRELPERTISLNDGDKIIFAEEINGIWLDAFAECVGRDETSERVFADVECLSACDSLEKGFLDQCVFDCSNKPCNEWRIDDYIIRGDRFLE